jgi:predicted amidohydrolase YtcJ
MKHERRKTMCGLVLLSVLWNCPRARPASPVAGPVGGRADLLLIHGRVYTSNPAQPWAQALAIRGTTIVAVGSDAEAQALRGPRTRVIDLVGRMAMPGIIDSHIHFLDGSLALDQFTLDNAYTLEEIQGRVRDYAAAHPKRPWLLGRGWLYDAFKPSGLPTRQLIDAIVSDRPVVVECYDGHSVWVNSKALALAGITKDTPDIRQGNIVLGTVVRDPQTQQPTGVLKEEAMGLVRRVIPPPSRKSQLAALRAGLAEANREGLTSAVNASGSLEEMEFYDELRRNGQLTVRMTTALMMEPKLSPQTLARYEDARRRFHDAWVRAGVIKAFMDGVVESHTAAMLEPYADNPKLTGSLNYAPEQFRENVVELDRRRFQLMTHAIGDRAIRSALDAYQAAQETNGPRDRRFRIEHIENINPADIARFGRLGVIAAMQPYHCYPEPNLLNIWARNIGLERLPYSFAWHGLAAAGARLAFGSDWPVVSLNPFIGIQNAVTRQDDQGLPVGGWVGPQRVTLEQALAAYTRDAAYADFQENVKGTLEPGKLADVIVLSQNLFDIRPLDIGKTMVLLTLVGGNVVVHRPGL